MNTPPLSDEEPDASHRAQAYINAYKAAIGEAQVTPDSREMRDEADYYLPAVLADCFTLAAEYGMDLLWLMSKAYQRRTEDNNE